MSFDQLKNYVNSQRLSGTPDEQIVASLREKRWHEELIARALKESDKPPKPTPAEAEIASRLFSVRELISASWSTLTEQFSLYVLCTLATIFAPIGVFVIFIAPIIYDVFVLHFNATDFISKSMLPVVILHFALGIITLILVALWGSLALYTIAAHEGKITLGHAFKRAWERLPGFIWVGLLSSITIILGLFVFIIPGLIFSVYLTFTALAYVVHGSRGRSALLASITLVHGRWWKTFWRIFAPSLLMALFMSIAGAILPGVGGFAAEVIVTPFMIIYYYHLYQNLVAFSKAHPKEEKVNIDEIAQQVKNEDK
jgi:hypothetical protein